jgi:hypothetical protein
MMAITVNYLLNVNYPVSIIVSVLDNNVEIASEEQFFPFEKVPAENLNVFATTLENSINNALISLSTLSYQEKLNLLIELIQSIKLKIEIDKAIA